MSPEKLFARIIAGNHANVSFADLVSLLLALGFEEERVSGSHHLFRHPALRLQVNLQPAKDGDAKPYQVRQVLGHIQAHGLVVKRERR